MRNAGNIAFVLPILHIAFFTCAPLILAVDRVLDMCRTNVNVFSDSCDVVTNGKLEGELGILGEPKDELLEKL